jgi:threonine synthase
MRLEHFEPSDRELVLPVAGGSMYYHCLSCDRSSGIDQLLYTCPHCGGVLLIDGQEPARLTPQQWRRRFDLRKLLTLPPVQGIFRYHELIAPILPLDSIIYLGEGHTPMIEASPALAQEAGMNLAFKNDGQNPSASF